MRPEVEDTVTGTVTIDVTAVNDPPVAVADDSYATDEDVPLTVAPPGVLGNDTDVDNLPADWTASVEDDAVHGSLSLGSDGGFTYTPDPDFNGGDSFTYRTYDGVDYSAPATVTIAVNPVDDLPEAINDSASPRKTRRSTSTCWRTTSLEPTRRIGDSPRVVDDGHRSGERHSGDR